MGPNEEFVGPNLQSCHSKEFETLPLSDKTKIRRFRSFSELECARRAHRRKSMLTSACSRDHCPNLDDFFDFTHIFSANHAADGADPQIYHSDPLGLDPQPPNLAARQECTSLMRYKPDESPKRKHEQRNRPDAAALPDSEEMRETNKLTLEMRYNRAKAHNALGSEQRYSCTYCSVVKTSASLCADGRVRIRCWCGGHRQDGQKRMHANWKAVDTSIS